MAKRYVLDVTAITDPKLKEKFDVKDLSSAVEKFIETLFEASVFLKYTFYISPALFEELKRFLIVNKCDEMLISKLSSYIIVKDPSKLEVRIPAAVMSQYVGDIRKRMNKGLRVAETAILKTAEATRKTPGKNIKDITGPIIKDLRERYRETVEQGIISNIIDFDIVILAHELHATLITSNEGMIKLCETLGIPYLTSSELVDEVKERLLEKRKLKRI